MLADFLTMQEQSGGAPWAEVSLAYVGDARNNMGNSMLVMAAIMGADVRIVAPRELWPAAEIQRAGPRARRRQRGPDHAHRGSAARAWRVPSSCTPTCGSRWARRWTLWDARVELLRPYRVDAALMAATGRADARFLHCLPAYHDARTAVGRLAAERFGMPDGIEVSDEVFRSPASVVFSQAHNRMHTIKALMVATLAA